MSEYVIKVDNLGKSYTIRHQQAERYTTLRDALAHRMYNLGRHLWGNDQNSATPTLEEFWALKDVCFEVKQGERIGIIGRNGAGKSTLLKILSRITEPTSGRVHIRGRVASLLEVGTGFHPELTGRENLYLNGAILGMSRSEIQRKFDEIVAFAEVEKFLDTPVKRYSSGMYVRLAFAVAAHLEPEILVVDEVLAVGDAEFQKKCLGKMRDVASEGRTVLFVSHNMGAVQQLCSRGLLLNKGQIQLDGSVNQATLDYLSVGLTQEGERTWPILDEAPGSEVVRMSAVRIRSENDAIKTKFTVRDSILIELEYQVLLECPLDAYVFLYNEMGNCVFVSIDNKDSRWHNTTRQSGLYRSTCPIPGDFLNNGQYTVSVYISQNLDKAVMHVAETETVNFAVTDSPDEDGVRGNYRRSWPSTIIRPRLYWTVERLQ